MKNRGQNIGIIGAGGIGALFGSTMQKKGYNVFFLKKSMKSKKFYCKTSQNHTKSSNFDKKN